MSEGWSTLQHHSQGMPLSLCHTHANKIKSKQSDKCEKWHCLQVARTGGVSEQHCVSCYFRHDIKKRRRRQKSKKKLCEKNSRSPFSSIRTYTPTKECVSRKQQQRCCQQRRSALIGSDQFEKNHHNSHSIRFD